LQAPVNRAPPAENGGSDEAPDEERDLLTRQRYLLIKQQAQARPAVNDAVHGDATTADSKRVSPPRSVIRNPQPRPPPNTTVKQPLVQSTQPVRQAVAKQVRAHLLSDPLQLAIVLTYEQVAHKLLTSTTDASISSSVTAQQQHMSKSDLQRVDIMPEASSGVGGANKGAQRTTTPRLTDQLQHRTTPPLAPTTSAAANQQPSQPARTQVMPFRQ
jgi:hypothetical protein